LSRSFFLPSLTVGLLTLIANHFGQANSTVEKGAIKRILRGNGSGG